MIQILVLQLVKMALYIGIGVIVCRARIVSHQECRAISQLLLYVVIPCVIVKSYVVLPAERQLEVLQSLGIGVLLLFTAILFARLLFRKRPVDQFAAAFSNAGFVGIPLITNVLGADQVFYIAGMIAVLNLLQWTYGQHILGGDASCASLRSCLKSPLLVSFLIGLAIYFFRIPIPALLVNFMEDLSACNAPLAMIVLGISIGDTSLAALFGSARLYWISTVRLLVIPIISLLVLGLVPKGSVEMKLALLIAASAPIGANLVLYAQKNGQDDGYCARAVCLSTLLSLVTIPVIVFLATHIW